ncbi:hypothetical protein BDW42DRAFT_164705 [Aspergillus taichungensis]|uniref:Uncharacterized protein n=1 Tax=Aspergillus taichungensis TaxID=482145 RepID=A0A2J5I1A8_9EURO|nr:hypothetical protein BDW42DRAFT_164705 [Aspergillus taichungensis]
MALSSDSQDNVARYATDPNMLKKKKSKKYQATNRTASNIPRPEKTPRRKARQSVTTGPAKPPYCRTRLNTSKKKKG